MIYTNTQLILIYYYLCHWLHMADLHKQTLAQSPRLTSNGFTVERTLKPRGRGQQSADAQWCIDLNEVGRFFRSFNYS